MTFARLLPMLDELQAVLEAHGCKITEVTVILGSQEADEETTPCVPPVLLETSTEAVAHARVRTSLPDCRRGMEPPR